MMLEKIKNRKITCNIETKIKYKKIKWENIQTKGDMFENML